MGCLTFYNSNIVVTMNEIKKIATLLYNVAFIINILRSGSARERFSVGGAKNVENSLKHSSQPNSICIFRKKTIYGVQRVWTKPPEAGEFSRIFVFKIIIFIHHNMIETRKKSRRTK